MREFPCLMELPADGGNRGLAALLYENMSQQSRDLTDAQWMILDPLIPELRGPICPTIILLTRPAIGGFSSGFGRAF
jgi:hypothetical protein